MATKQYEVTATVYDRKMNVLARATNSYFKSHPKQARLAKRAGLPDKIYLHSEIHALIKALKRGEPYKIKVERYDMHGNPKLAKPCPICELALKEANVKLIEYTVG